MCASSIYDDIACTEDCLKSTVEDALKAVAGKNTPFPDTCDGSAEFPAGIKILYIIITIDRISRDSRAPGLEDTDNSRQLVADYIYNVTVENLLRL